MLNTPQKLFICLFIHLLSGSKNILLINKEYLIGIFFVNIYLLLKFLIEILNEENRLYYFCITRNSGSISDIGLAAF